MVRQNYGSITEDHVDAARPYIRVELRSGKDKTYSLHLFTPDEWRSLKELMKRDLQEKLARAEEAHDEAL